MGGYRIRDNTLQMISWPIGIWPLQEYNIYSLIRYCFGIFCASILVIFPSVEFYMGCTNAEINIECLILVCCGVLGIIKTTCYRIYASNLIHTYGSAVNDYLTIENEKERTIMRRHAFIGRLLCCSLLSSSYGSCVIYILAAAVKNNQINITDVNVTLEYPVPAKCGIEYLNTSRSMQYVFFLIQSIAIMIANSANNGNDALLFNITLHVCGQVQILKTNFLNIDVIHPQIHERFIALIRRHIYLIRLANKLAGTTNFILLMQLFVTNVLLCIVGFQLILGLKINNYVLITKSTMAYCTFLLQLAIFCFIGDYLKSQMEEIKQSVCQSTWRDLSLKLQKCIIFIIMRTDTPVTLQAGSFIMITLPTYMIILKTSLSYLSVLRIMLEE